MARRIVVVDDAKPPYEHQEYPQWVTVGKDSFIVHNENEHRLKAPEHFAASLKKSDEVRQEEEKASELVKTLGEFLEKNGLSAEGKDPIATAMDLITMAMQPPPTAEAPAKRK